MNQKILFIILGIVVIVFIIILVVNKAVEETEILPEEGVKIAGWQIHRDKEHGFSFEYPENTEMITKQVNFDGKIQINLEDDCYVVFGGIPLGLPDTEVSTVKDFVEIGGVKTERETYLFPETEGFASIVLNYERNEIYPYFFIYHSAKDYCIENIDQILSTFNLLEDEKTPEDAKTEKPEAAKEPLTVQKILREAAEKRGQWEQFAAVYYSDLIIESKTNSISDKFERELVDIREKEGRKLRQETHQGLTYDENGIEKRIPQSLEKTAYHFAHGEFISCIGEKTSCRAFSEHTIESVEIISSLAGNEAEHLERLISLRIGLEPIIILSNEGTKEITYKLTMLDNWEEWRDAQPVKKISTCDMIGINFNIKPLAEFTDIKGEQPYGKIDPALSFSRGRICFDRELGIATYGEMDILQVSLEGQKIHVKTKMELNGFVSFHREPEGLVFPEIKI